MIPIYKQLFVIFIPMKVMQPVFFLLSGFSFKNIHESLDCRGRKRACL